MTEERPIMQARIKMSSAVEVPNIVRYLLRTRLRCRLVLLHWRHQDQWGKLRSGGDEVIALAVYLEKRASSC